MESGILSIQETKLLVFDIRVVSDLWGKEDLISLFINLLKGGLVVLWLLGICVVLRFVILGWVSSYFCAL